MGQKDQEKRRTIELQRIIEGGDIEQMQKIAVQQQDKGRRSSASKSIDFSRKDESIRQSSMPLFEQYLESHQEINKEEEVLNEIIDYDINYEYRLAKYDEKLDNQLDLKKSTRKTESNSQILPFTAGPYYQNNARNLQNIQEEQIKQKLNKVITFNQQKRYQSLIKNQIFLNFLLIEKIYLYLIGIGQKAYNGKKQEDEWNTITSFANENQFYDQLENNEYKDEIIYNYYQGIQSEMPQFINFNKQKKRTAKEELINQNNDINKNIDEVQKSFNQNLQLSRQQDLIKQKSPFYQSGTTPVPKFQHQSLQGIKEQYKSSQESSKQQKSSQESSKQQKKSIDNGKYVFEEKSTDNAYQKHKNKWYFKFIKQNKKNKQTKLNKFITQVKQEDFSIKSQWQHLLKEKIYGIPIIVQTIYPFIVSIILLLNLISFLGKLGKVKLTISLDNNNSLSFNTVITAIILFGRQLLLQYYFFITDSQEQLNNVLHQLKKEDLYFYKNKHYDLFFQDSLLFIIYIISVGGFSIARTIIVWFLPRLHTYSISLQKYAIYTTEINIPVQTQVEIYIALYCYLLFRQVSIIRIICIHMSTIDRCIQNYKQILAKDFILTVQCQLDQPLIKTDQNKQIFYKIVKYIDKSSQIVNPMITIIFLSCFVLILLGIYQLTFYTRQDTSNSFQSRIGAISQIIQLLYYFINMIIIFIIGYRCNKNVDAMREQILSPYNFIINKDNMEKKIDVALLDIQLNKIDVGFKAQGSKLSAQQMTTFIISLIAYTLTLITINL